MLIGGAIVGYYIDSFLFIEIRSCITFNITSFVIGITVMWLVLRISKNTGRTLAKYGRTGNISRMETNILVTEGVYKYMRHPMHLGLLFFPVAIAFIVGSPAFILIICPIEILFMLLMIKFVEEPEAIRKFGSEYLDYIEIVPWFCISKECLKELFKPVSKNHKNIEGKKYA
jgi:protein-S-isoprenylcysteine O-methyltransferase